MNWKLLGQRLLLEPLGADEVVSVTPGGVELPDSVVARQRYRRWRVAVVGEKVADPALLPGVEVIVQQMVGTPMSGGLVVQEDCIVAIVPD